MTYDAASYRAALKAAAGLVDRWHIRKGGYTELAAVIRSLPVPGEAPAPAPDAICGTCGTVRERHGSGGLGHDFNETPPPVRAPADPPAEAQACTCAEWPPPWHDPSCPAYIIPKYPDYPDPAAAPGGEDAEARIAELEAAIRWALGEGEEFPTRPPGAGSYWWRTELRARARLAARAGGRSGP